jgi:hypothetical protein
LPPPGEPEVAELSADRQTVHLARGHALRGAIVLLFNEQFPNDILGVVADSQGLYEVKKVPVDLSSSQTNMIQIWQTYGSDTSDRIRMAIPKGVAFGATPVDDGSTGSEGGAVEAGIGDAAE